jgi:malonate-semialdehyde dehydrogenase (acetylating) / methylmalonate-semialdehyde dehydrogenase
MRVLSIVHVRDLDEAFVFLEKSRYGNQASLFTSSGAAARRFRYEAPAGNIGINIGVAAPMAYFPFSGWKNSFSATCMPKEGIPSSSIRTKRWL